MNNSLFETAMARFSYIILSGVARFAAKYNKCHSDADTIIDIAQYELSATVARKANYLYSLMSEWLMADEAERVSLEARIHDASNGNLTVLIHGEDKVLTAGNVAAAAVMSLKVDDAIEAIVRELYDQLEDWEDMDPSEYIRDNYHGKDDDMESCLQYAGWSCESNIIEILTTQQCNTLVGEAIEELDDGSLRDWAIELLDNEGTQYRVNDDGILQVKE